MICFFATAQPHVARESAPSVLVATNTTSANAERRNYGTVQNAKPGETNKVAYAASMASPFVSTGNSFEAANRPPISKTTDAPDVEKTITVHNYALAERRTRALTPYKPVAWSEELSRHNLSQKYPTLVEGIVRGFLLGIPPLEHTYTPHNHMSVALHHGAYLENIGKEFQTGRYLGPYSRSEVEGFIGPFQTSPLSLVTKEGKPGKFRAVHNFSHPHDPTILPASINSGINADHYPCTWGTFETVSLVISRLPPGSQASVRDVAAAYRTIPAHHTQWPGLVVRLEGEDNYAINTSNNFGLSSAGGIYGHLADAGADIFRANGVGPLSKWVDDHIFFRILRTHLDSYNAKRAEWRCEIEGNGGLVHDGSRIWYRGKLMPNGKHEEFDEDCSASLQDCSNATSRPFVDREYSYNDADIDSISDYLGVVWESSKTVPFSVSIPYLGFIWDLSNHTVAVPERKKLKYLAAIEEWESKSAHALLEVQRLHGKLLHVTLVVPSGRAYLTNLEAMLGIFHNRPFVPRTPPRYTADDLKWWKTLLQQPVISRTIPRPIPILDINAYSDASSGVGIAITVGKYWRAWRLIPGWKSDGRDIGWAEAVGFEFLVRHLIRSTTTGTHITVYGDNTGVVEGWWSSRSRNHQVNAVFRRIHTLLQQCDVTVHTRYIPSKQNPADPPSRGLYADASLLLPHITIPTDVIPYVVDFDNSVINSWETSG